MSDPTVELSDREVDAELIATLQLLAKWANDPSIRPMDIEGIFACVVIPALDARGLGDIYANELAKQLSLQLNRSSQWHLLSASLSLRARAALHVLENANG